MAWPKDDNETINYGNIGGMLSDLARSVWDTVSSGMSGGYSAESPYYVPLGVDKLVDKAVASKPTGTIDVNKPTSSTVTAQALGNIAGPKNANAMGTQAAIADFRTNEEGWQALHNQIAKDMSRGLTVEGLAKKWAPFDNGSWLKNVTTELGVPANSPLTKLDAAALAKAIAKAEGNKGNNPGNLIFAGQPGAFIPEKGMGATTTKTASPTLLASNPNPLEVSPLNLPENRNEGAMTAMEGPNVFTEGMTPDVIRIGEDGLVPVRTADRKYVHPFDDKDLIPIPKGGVEVIRGNERLITDATGKTREVGGPYQGYAADRRKEDLARQVIESAMSEPATLGMHKKYNEQGNLLEEGPVANPRAGAGLYGGTQLLGGVGTTQRAEETNELKMELAKLGIDKAEAARLGQDVKILATRPQWNEETQKYDQIFDPSRVGPAYKLLKAMQAGKQEEIDKALKEYHSGSANQPPAGFKPTGKMRNGKPEYYDEKSKRYWTE
jgi:hypothetical protein